MTSNHVAIVQSPMEKGAAFHLTNLNFLHQRMIVRSSLEIHWTSGSGEEF